MKKIICLIMAMAMLFTFVGCGNNEIETDENKVDVVSYNLDRIDEVEEEIKEMTSNIEYVEKDGVTYAIVYEMINDDEMIFDIYEDSTSELVCSGICRPDEIDYTYGEWE